MNQEKKKKEIKIKPLAGEGRLSAANHGHPLEGTLSQCLWLIRVRSILFFDLLVIPPFARFWLWLISIQKDETHQAVHIEPLCCYVRTVESGKKKERPPRKTSLVSRRKDGKHPPS
jgi:hypothetical protein